MSEYSRRMLDVYRQDGSLLKFGFLSSMFATKPGDIMDAEEVEFDIVRGDEDIAPVLTDYKTGSHVISQEVFTNKKIKPPTFSLQEPFNAYDLAKRQAGETVYQASTETKAKLAMKIMQSWNKMVDMIKRTMEVQASQILQSGIITLYNSQNVAAYTLDYKMKATHKATVTKSWSDATADVVGDIEAMCDVVRDDGLCDIKIMLMGSDALKNALANTKFAELFKKDQFNQGSLDFREGGRGEKYQGYVVIGNYRLEIYTYNASYKALSGSKAKYIDDDYVVFLPDLEELDFRKCFCGIPSMIDVDPRFAQYLPGRVSVSGAIDFKPRIFVDEKEETLFAEIKSRPILIPRSIDRFASLLTKKP